MFVPKGGVQSCATEEMTMSASGQGFSRTVGCWCYLQLTWPSSADPLTALADRGEAERRGQIGLLSRWEALHEVDLLLVGERVIAAARPAPFSEAHIPACVAC